MVNRNWSVFKQWCIQLRMLCDVSNSDMSVMLFGCILLLLILFLLVGVLDFCYLDVDLVVGWVVVKLGVFFIFSNQVSVLMEEVSVVMGDSLCWFQLYWSKFNELVVSLVQCVEVCGCEVIVVMFDMIMLGWCLCDLDQVYFLFLWGKGIVQYISDFVFQVMFDELEEEGLVLFKWKIILQILKVVYEFM